MNFFGYLIILVLLTVLAVTGILLVSFIGGNFRNGQRLREGLSQRVSMLRLKKMLVERGIDIKDYLHDSMIHDVEKHIRICESCNKLSDCDAALNKVNTKPSDLSFCPNDAEFRLVKTRLAEKRLN